jgi:hypothetical protein
VCSTVQLCSYAQQHANFRFPRQAYCKHSQTCPTRNPAVQSTSTPTQVALSSQSQYKQECQPRYPQVMPCSHTAALQQPRKIIKGVAALNQPHTPRTLYMWHMCWTPSHSKDVTPLTTKTILIQILKGIFTFTIQNTLAPSAPSCVGLADLSVMPPQRERTHCGS